LYIYIGNQQYYTYVTRGSERVNFLMLKKKVKFSELIKVYICE